MPRLHQVSRAESDAPIVTAMYDLLFGDRDPVAEPGTATGTPGDWWPTFANVPDILEHAVQGFGLYQSSRRVLDPLLRELGQARAGWSAGSQFVYSQHCKSLRALGVPDDKIAAVAQGRGVVLHRAGTTRARLHRLPGARPRPGTRRAVQRAV
jgi:alkylhydroperoxidase family enzyme